MDCVGETYSAMRYRDNPTLFTETKYRSGLNTIGSGENEVTMSEGALSKWYRHQRAAGSLNGNLSMEAVIDLSLPYQKRTGGLF